MTSNGAVTKCTRPSCVNVTPAPTTPSTSGTRLARSWSTSPMPKSRVSVSAKPDRVSSRRLTSGGEGSEGAVMTPPQDIAAGKAHCDGAGGRLTAEQGKGVLPEQPEPTPGSAGRTRGAGGADVPPDRVSPRGGKGSPLHDASLHLPRAGRRAAGAVRPTGR